MESIRKPFQGVWNIIRFNWHFFVLSIGAILVLGIMSFVLPAPFDFLAQMAVLFALVPTLISLTVSWYVYDQSNLYSFDWLPEFKQNASTNILNINAGFDETSELLNKRFKEANLQVFDFYDPEKHTEVSIKRARKAYPPFPGTRSVETSNLPLQEQSLNHIFAILSAHEIRDESERILFFKELKKALAENGQIIVTEHLRDFANFLAYNIGFFHFHSKATWLKTFQAAGLEIDQEIKITPFISTFILKKHGITS